MFLNHQCSDAMSLADFIDKVQVSLADLQYTTQHGYIKGINNIFVKHLSHMPAKKRPIHCTDRKRLHFYVNENHVWKQDQRHERMDSSIKEIAHKQIQQIQTWQLTHPNFIEPGTPDNLEWNNIINKTMGGSDDKERERLKTSIKRNVSTIVGLKDAMSG